MLNAKRGGIAPNRKALSARSLSEGSRHNFGQAFFAFYAHRVNGRPDFRNHRWLADGLILLVIAFALRAPAIGLSEIDWDESNFSLVAREILRGHWPYTAVFD